VNVFTHGHDVFILEIVEISAYSWYFKILVSPFVATRTVAGLFMILENYVLPFVAKRTVAADKNQIPV